MKYYIYRFHKDYEFKRTKCNDYWSKNHSKCWQFSKQGATKIVDRLKIGSKGFYQYGTVAVDEAEQMLADFEKH